MIATIVHCLAGAVMTTLKDFAIDTLMHSNMRKVNFQYGGLRVYPSGFATIASAIRNGHIRLIGANLSSGADYDPSTRPGRQHTIRVDTSFVTPGGSSSLLSLSAKSERLLRMAIVHECTHALQDYQRVTATPELAEGAAYVAGWIAAIQWGYTFVPTGGHQAIARNLARQIIAGSYNVRPILVHSLGLNVPTARASYYVFNGI